MKKEVSQKTDHVKDLDNGENFNKVKFIDCITGFVIRKHKAFFKY